MKACVILGPIITLDYNQEFKTREIALYVYKCLAGLAPEYLASSIDCTSRHANLENSKSVFCGFKISILDPKSVFSIRHPIMKVLLKWVELSEQSKVVLLSNPCTIGVLTLIFHLEKNVRLF